MTDAKVSVAIIIPTLNEEDNIHTVIESLRCKDFPYKIIVVDGGSTDRTCSIVRVITSTDRRVELLHNPDKIQAAGVNLAVAKLGFECRYFIRADAHCSYPDGWADKIVHHLIDTGATSVVVPMVTKGKEPVQRAIAAAQNSPLGNGGSAHRSVHGHNRYVDHGHHAGFLTEFFIENGGYDATFAVNEDAEFDIRTARKGARWMAFDAPITYYPRKTILALGKQYFRYGFGRGRTVFKHGVRPKLRQLGPVLIFLHLGFGVLLALFNPLFLLGMVPYLGLCLYFARKITPPNETTKFTANVFFASIVMHACWGAGFVAQAMSYLDHKLRRY